MNSKVDVTIMNQTRLNRSLLPAEKRIIRPSDLPVLPVYTEDDLKAMERFLEDESNLSVMVSLRMFCIDFSRLIWSLYTNISENDASDFLYLLYTCLILLALFYIPMSANCRCDCLIFRFIIWLHFP